MENADKENNRGPRLFIRFNGIDELQGNEGSFLPDSVCDGKLTAGAGSVTTFFPAHPWRNKWPTR
ncbi:MAG: hypothetical protein NUV63_07220 [Gallionella sp.]|nr:hypothetical protein [Gallionella sp.]